MTRTAAATSSARPTRSRPRPRAATPFGWSRGDFVEFTLTHPTNAITVRYSIPDAPQGGGIRSPLEVAVDGRRAEAMTLTSAYAWLYADYPFSNDPQSDWLHPDWWRPPTETQVRPHRPNHFYDEQRLLLGKTYRAGAKLRLTVPVGAAADWTVVDLLDYERVAEPKHRPARAVPVTRFGADPSGRRDSSAAFDAAIAYARRKPGRRPVVWIPEGTFKVTRHIIVDDVAVVGAGNWYSVVTGPATPLENPDPDPECPTCEPSRTDSVGFYGKWAEDGGSHNVRLADFAIVGEISERVDTDEVNGIGGALSDSVVEGLYIQHTKVGIWLDGPGRDLLVRDNVIVDQMADGINIRKGWRNVRATNNFFRNTGDDAMAMWSNIEHDAGNVYDHNTIQTPVLANGIAIYGGEDNTVSDNLVADPVREGSALHAGFRHASTDFRGHLTFARNTTVRAGTRELNWDIGLGAIWFYALEGHMNADFRVLDSDFLDVSYNAIQFISEWGVKDQYGIENVTVSQCPGGRRGHERDQRALVWQRHVRERRRPQRRAAFRQQLRVVQLPAHRPGVRDHEDGRQRRRMVRLGDVVRRPPGHGGAARAVAVEAAVGAGARRPGVVDVARQRASRRAPSPTSTTARTSCPRSCASACSRAAPSWATGAPTRRHAAAQRADRRHRRRPARAPRVLVRRSRGGPPAAGRVGRRRPAAARARDHPGVPGAARPLTPRDPPCGGRRAAPLLAGGRRPARSTPRSTAACRPW